MMDIDDDEEDLFDGFSSGQPLTDFELLLILLLTGTIMSHALVLDECHALALSGAHEGL
jgi:hypothetical protein